MSNTHTYTQVIDPQPFLEEKAQAHAKWTATYATLQDTRKDLAAAELKKRSGEPITATEYVEANASVELAEAANAAAEAAHTSAKAKVPLNLTPARRVANALTQLGLPVEYGNRVNGTPSETPAFSVIPLGDGDYDRERGTYGKAQGRLSNLAKVRVAFHGNDFSKEPDIEVIRRALSWVEGIDAHKVASMGIGKWDISLCAYDEVPAVSPLAAIDLGLFQSKAQDLVRRIPDEATMTIRSAAVVPMPTFKILSEKAAEDGTITRMTEVKVSVSAGAFSRERLEGALSSTVGHLLAGLGVVQEVTFKGVNTTHRRVEAYTAFTQWGQVKVPASEHPSNHFTFQVEAVCKYVEPAKATDADEDED